MPMPPVTIQQPAPCHESWAAMTPTEAGRHCAACQTEVVDFTRMTDGEVVAFLRHTIPGRRCGTFREDQVGRPLLAAARPVTGLRRWAGAAVLLLGSVVGLKARAQGLGQNPVPDAGKVKPVAGKPAAIPDSLFLVQGVVRNRLGIHKAGVTVWVTGLKYVRTTSNGRGYFRLLVPQSGFGSARYVVLYYDNSRGIRFWARVPFDSTRTRPYHIRLKKQPPLRAPGFY
jgi:hypothetical protein